MSTATGPAASWDEPLPEGKDRTAPEATAQSAAGREAAAEAAASWDDPLAGDDPPEPETKTKNSWYWLGYDPDQEAGS